MDWNIKYHLLEIHAPNNSCSTVQMFAVSSPPAQPDVRAHRHTAGLHNTCTPTATPGHFHIACHLSVWPQDMNRPPPMPINTLKPIRSYFWTRCFLTSGKKTTVLYKDSLGKPFCSLEQLWRWRQIRSIGGMILTGAHHHKCTMDWPERHNIDYFYGESRKVLPNQGSAENCEGVSEKSWKN
jgi:hypothetical protein